MIYYLGYEVADNITTIYIFYILNLSSHTALIITVNPLTHTVLNYSSAIPSFLFTAILNGSPTIFHLQGGAIPSYEMEAHNAVYIYSANRVLLQEISNGQNITLRYANFPGIASEPIPNLYSLAGHIQIFKLNVLTLLGVVLSLQLFLILKKVIK